MAKLANPNKKSVVAAKGQQRKRQAYEIAVQKSVSLVSAELERSGVMENPEFRAGTFTAVRNYFGAADQYEPGQIAAAIIVCASKGLVPGRDAEFIPYGKDLSLNIKSEGYRRIVESTGGRLYEPIIYYENDDPCECYTCIDPNDGQYKLVFSHKPAQGDRGKPMGVFVPYRKPGQDRDFVEDVKRDYIERCRETSRMKDGTPWTKWWEQMWIKTALKFVGKKFTTPSFEMNTEGVSVSQHADDDYIVGSTARVVDEAEHALPKAEASSDEAPSGDAGEDSAESEKAEEPPPHSDDEQVADEEPPKEPDPAPSAKKSSQGVEPIDLDAPLS